MKKEVQRKVRLSISLSKMVLDLLDIRTSNRSNYIDMVLLEYFKKKGDDTSNIKL